MKPKPGEGCCKRESNEAILIEEPPRIEEKKHVCICGKCVCRKHHCPLHPSWTSRLIATNTMRSEYNPKSDYQNTFKPHKARRPGLKVPARVLPVISGDKMQLVSVNHTDFVPLPLDDDRKSFKPVQNAHMCTEKFDSSTTYTRDYPNRPYEPTHATNGLMHTTMSHPTTGYQSYSTTNEAMLRKWSGDHRQPAYCEIPSQLRFEGKFNGKTVNHSDFTQGAIANGKPSTSCKRTEKMYQSSAKFSKDTTNNMDYTLPQIVERTQPYLKKCSKKHEETMDHPRAKGEYQTQYGIDNPGFDCFPLPRGMCPPVQDSLQLFDHSVKGGFRTENMANYTRFQDPPRPRTSFKITEQPINVGSNVMVKHYTSTGSQFQPVPFDKQMAELRDVDSLAHRVGYTQKNGLQLKQAQNFGGHFSDTTINKSEYFQFWNTKPRVRYGDSSERIYQPSSSTFASVSETKSSFVPLEGKPSESFKPLDLRFHKEKGITDKIPMVTETGYKSDYPVRPLIIPETCPALKILKSTT